MANGVRLRLNFYRQKDCRRSGSTPRRVTMRRPNNVPRLLLLFFSTLFLVRSGVQGAAQNQPFSSPVASSQSSAPPNSQSGAAPAPANTAPAATSKAQSPNDSPNPAQNPDGADSGVFVFRKQVEEVVLHATVIDDKQRIVTSLDKGDFNVYEDGRPQTITSFRHEDIPVAMGIVVDNSGSMREKRQKVNAAALNLVRSSNPEDQVCVVNFNDEYWLDQDFTSNIGKLKEGLEKIEARGGTALYDAVIATAKQLKSAKLEKRIIFVVTDGEDN